ncbi:BnaA09g03460D [Brassica napus]|uniref:(rape) hypothetical protein n=1 Tax=Brassica napus TaxID=3708 RepID=A0A078J1C4_BRANA|nr:unnamed protein product [Brassica napus]CDY57019.1 BnaA09g03460D [Brassica napus]
MFYRVNPTTKPKGKRRATHRQRKRERRYKLFVSVSFLHTCSVYRKLFNIEDVHLVCVTSLSLLHKKSFCVKRLRETMKSLKRERVLFLLFLGLGFGFVGFFLSHPFYVPVKKRRSRDESCFLL